MKRFFTSLCLAGVLAGTVGTMGSHAAGNKPSMSISILAPKSAISAVPGGWVSMNVKVTGVAISKRTIGRKPKAGQGHIQIYLDRIPAAAYTTTTGKNLVLTIGTPKISFKISRQWASLHQGQHRFILALAKNNDVLYHAPTASIAVTVK